MEQETKTPGQTYLEKLEHFRNSLTEEENKVHCKINNDMQDMRKNQILQEVSENIKELYKELSKVQINKNNIIKIIEGFKE